MKPPKKKNMKILMENSKSENRTLSWPAPIPWVAWCYGEGTEGWPVLYINKVVPQFGIVQLVNIIPITAYGRYTYTFLSLRFL